MFYAVMGLPATYTVEAAIADITLTGRFIVRVSGRFIGVADSMRDARMSARLHASLIGDAVLH